MGGLNPAGPALDGGVKGSYLRRFFRLLLSVIYLIAGIAHIQSPDGFLAITPGWVPFPEQVIFFTGVAEIAGAIGLLIPPPLVPPIRYAARVGLAPFSRGVFSAHLH